MSCPAGRGSQITRPFKVGDRKLNLRLYVDVPVPRPVDRGLRRRGIDVLTAQEDGADLWEDPDDGRSGQICCICLPRKDLARREGLKAASSAVVSVCSRRGLDCFAASAFKLWPR